MLFGLFFDRQNSMGAKKILVVDDSEICRKMAKHTLQQCGYDIVELSSALGLSRTLQKERPNLVLIDVNMPALQGDLAIEIVRRYGILRCPIVFYSDQPQERLAGLIEKTGANGFIPKDGDPQTLLSLVKKYINESAPQPLQKKKLISVVEEDFKPALPEESQLHLEEMSGTGPESR
jgi:CheY-like chemotaxis protein